MTTRALFDMGVYKTTLKRFSLGSVLYFIMLFLCTGMLILLAYEPDLFYYEGAGLILEEEFVFPSVWIALFVPTVVALLCYRFMHSKKTAIFVHSLPVTREANYISTLAGAFSLMALPVIANGFVLFLISLCGYRQSFGLGDICVWVAINLLVLFVMFSVATFASMCTGNSFAQVAINVILLFAPMLIATVAETIMLEFLYGYSYTRNLLDFATEINPVFFIGEVADGIAYAEELNWIKIWAFIGVATLLYVLAYLMYKYRHTETSEEVAGFKVLNPIFKYFVTFVGTISVFSLFSQFLGKKNVLFTFVVILASVILYFGSEMLLKKTIKVWKSYKGYLVFGAIFTAFILFLGLTSVFGYETYVPDFEDIEEAAIYNYYYQDKEPFTKDEMLNKYIIEVHQDLVKSENRTILSHDDYRYTRIHIDYKLKNGRLVTRRYPVDEKTNDRVMEEVYSYEVYKDACEAVLNNKIKKVESITIGSYDIDEVDEDLEELFECIKADVKALDYEKLRLGIGAWCNVRYVKNEETDAIEPGRPYSHVYYDWLELRINRYYEQTLKWLDENGYRYVVVQILGSDGAIDATSVDLATMGDVTISCHWGDLDVESVITDEAEIQTLRDIFNGYYIAEKGNYSFDDDICISFGNGEIWFCPELNDRNKFRLKNTDMIITVTESERLQVKAICEKYGMVLPTDES